MSNNEEVLRNKLLNNEKIENNSSWNMSDNYYCENEDVSLNQFVSNNIGYSQGIKSIVLEFHKCLVNRYHNKFFLEYKKHADCAEFILRGQPFFDNTYLSLIVKYTLCVKKDDFKLTPKFVNSGTVIFDYERSFIDNYNFESKVGLFGRLKNIANNPDNSDDIKDYLAPIDLIYIFNTLSYDTSSDKKVSKSRVKSDEKENISKATPTKTKHIDINKNVIKNKISSMDKTDWSIDYNKSFVTYCVECGEANYPLNETCTKCNSTLLFYHAGVDEMDSVDEFLCQASINRIRNTPISEEFYEYLLERVTAKAGNVHLSSDMNVFDKILYLCRHYVTVIPNDEIDDFGLYDFNSIVVNPGYSRSQQCSTLIKYLAMDIHVEILEALIMYIFDIRNNNIVRSLVEFCRIVNPFEAFVREYMCTRVESHFIPDEYHNYEKVEQYFLSRTFDEETFKMGILVGTSFAKDIIGVLEDVISKDIVNDLEKQFLLDEEETTEAIRRFNSFEVLSFDEKIEVMKGNLVMCIELLMSNDDAHSKFIEIKNTFEGLEKSNRC